MKNRTLLRKKIPLFHEQITKKRETDKEMRVWQIKNFNKMRLKS